MSEEMVKEKYSIKIIQCIDEIEEIRPIWEKMQWHPNADIDFYLTIIQSRPNILQPYIMVLFVNDKPKAMMIGRIEKNKFPIIKFGYKTLYQPQLRSLTIIYGGLLGDCSYVEKEIFISELWKSLKNGNVDIAHLAFTKVNCDLNKLVKTKIGFFFRDYVILPNIHRKMILPDTIDAFYNKMKRKHRNLPKLLEKNYPGKISFKVFQIKDQIDIICKEIETISTKSYQRGLNVGFKDNIEYRQRLTLWANKGALRVYILYIKDISCAYWIGTIYGKTFHLNDGAYDPYYKKYSPGTYIFFKLIEDLCQNNNVKEMDFGFGEAHYKKRFSTHEWFEENIYIFSPTIRGVYLNLIRGLFNLFSIYAENILKSLHLKDKVKKIWRKKLTKSNQS